MCEFLVVSVCMILQHCGHVSDASMVCNVRLGLEIESWHEVQSGLAADRDREWNGCYLCCGIVCRTVALGSEVQGCHCLLSSDLPHLHLAHLACSCISLQDPSMCWRREDLDGRKFMRM